MRRLMWFTLGFCAACGLGFWVVPQNQIQVVAALSALLCTLGFFFRNQKYIRPVLALCLGCAAGSAWFLLFYNHVIAPVSVWNDTELFLSITASDYSHETDYGIAVDGTITLEEKTYKVRVYLDEKQTLSPGDQVNGSFRLRFTLPDKTGASTYYVGNGVFLKANQKGEVEILRAKEKTVKFFPAELAKEIKLILKRCFPPDTFPFAKALLLGDTTDLDYELDTALQLSGIRHVVAVSGLHVSILFTLIGFLTLKNRYLTAGFGFPVLLLFAALAGFTPSVTRACIMCALMLLGRLVNKEYDGPTALSFAVLVMLVQNPMAVTSVSLQLSAASVAGIFLFYESINTWFLSKFGDPKGKKIVHKLLRWFASTVGVTLSAMTLTTPLCALYFGAVSLVGPLTNLLTLWVVSFVFCGIMVVCIVSLVCGGCASILAQIVSVPIRYILFCAKTLGKLPLAAVYTRSVYIVIWLVLCYILLAVFYFQKDRKPKQLLCCASIALCFGLLLSWAEPFTASVRMTVLDVGHGQSILLQSDGRTFLVDCGGDSDTETADIIAETLLSQGISHLDGVILTHYDRDHAGALPYLLTRIDTQLLLLPRVENTLGELQTKGRMLYISNDVAMDFGEAKLTVFAPIFAGSENENSMCVLFEGENCAILITGDRSSIGERMLLEHTALPHVDVLIAGHHGSANSTCEELLRTVNPDTVIISAGEDNIYGHPAQDTLQRLGDYGCTVYRTDRDGTIIFRR